MPPRSNRFQSLATQIQKALFGSRAKVVESAMIRNYVTEVDTEVDVLIEFEAGGNIYRTSVECRDHGRPAGPDWISQLKMKREQCRLDKTIAIHSRGFSKTAMSAAVEYGIETLRLREVATADWKEHSLPFTKYLVVGAHATIPDQHFRTFAFIKTSESPPQGDVTDIKLPGDSPVGLSEFLLRVAHTIQLEVINRASPSPAKSSSLPVEIESNRPEEFFIPLPPGSQLGFEKGNRWVDAGSFSGIAIVRVERRLIDVRKTLLYGESVVTEANGSILQIPVQITTINSSQNIIKASVQTGASQGNTNPLSIPIYTRASLTREYIEESLRPKPP